MGTNGCSPGEAKRLAKHINALVDKGVWDGAVLEVQNNDRTAFDTLVKPSIKNPNDRDIIWNGIKYTVGLPPGPGFTW